MQRNLARTTQPVRPVLQTEITNVCVLPDLLAMTVKWVRIITNNWTALSQSFVRTNSQGDAAWWPMTNGKLKLNDWNQTLKIKIKLALHEHLPGLMPMKCFLLLQM